VTRVAGALLPVLLLSCGLLPSSRDPRAVVTAEPGDADAVHSLEVVPLPAERHSVDSVLLLEGIGLRRRGGREDLAIRHAFLGPGEEARLLTAVAPDADRTAGDGPFADGDVLEVTARPPGPGDDSFSLTLFPRIEAERLDGYDVGAVVRPASGAFVPVLRGRLPVRGSASVVVTGEVEGRRVFAALLRFAFEGSERAARAPTPTRHDLRIRRFDVESSVLSSVLAEMEIPEPGGAGGLGACAVPTAHAARLATRLGEVGSAAPAQEEGAPARIRLGGLLVVAEPRFRLLDYSYRTRLSVPEWSDAPPLEVGHGEREPALVIAWEAETPGRSVAALIDVTPR